MIPILADWQPVVMLSAALVFRSAVGGEVDTEADGADRRKEQADGI